MKLSIPLENIESLKIRFSELERKAKKLGVPCPELILGEVYHVEHKFDYKDGFLLPFPVLDYFQKIELLGEGIDKPISYGGYVVLGVYNHEYDRSVYNSFSPDTKPLPQYTKRFQDKNVSHCEHCNKTIRRNNTYLIASEDGKQMLVGSSCMRAFVPLGKSVGSIVAYYKSVFSDYLNDELFDEDKRGDSSNRFVPTFGFLFQVMLIRKFTNVSASDKEGMGAMLYAVNEHGFYKEYGIGSEDIIETRCQVADLVSWWKERDIQPTQEFDYKIQTIVMSDMMRNRDVNITCWAVHKWLDTFAQDKVKVEDGDNEFIGSPGERLESVEVFLERDQFLYESHFGVIYLYVFKTPNGNTIVWKTTPKNIKPGSKFKLSGRVKDHATFNGINQTSVIRPTIREYEDEK